MERWKSVPGYHGRYEVSDQGRVRSLAQTTSDGRRLKAKILAGRPQKSGHLSVSLTSDGINRNALVHRLVLIAFTGQPPTGMHALHIDGNPANNRLPNLRWGTPSENSLDAVRHGVHPQAPARAIAAMAMSSRPRTRESTAVTSGHAANANASAHNDATRKRRPERQPDQ